MKLETETDVLRENKAKLLLSELSGLQFKKIKKPYSKIDWVVTRSIFDRPSGNWDTVPIAWCEFKGQNKGIFHAKKFGFRLGLEKWMHLKKVSYATDMPFWIVYGIKKDNDKGTYIGMFWKETKHDGMYFGGRVDRIVKSDLDVMVKLRFDRFAKVNTKEDWELVKHKLTAPPQVSGEY